MKKLHVLYDGQCALCRRCRGWLSAQPAYVELEFLPLQLGAVSQRFPGVEHLDPERQLIVVADTGEVWAGVDAWILCLWALREYRKWALRLVHPLLKPFARRVCELVSANRLDISRWFFGQPAERTAEMLEKVPDERWSEIMSAPKTRRCG